VRRLRQEALKFKVSLDHIVRLDYIEKKKTLKFSL
jgi:hypothetical protein